jgi:NADH:ubiquinone oxidoreductase subunit 4 (subunit M)
LIAAGAIPLRLMVCVVLFANDRTRFCGSGIIFYCRHHIYETRAIDEMGGIRTQAQKFASLFLILVLASLLITFNFVGEFTVLYSLSLINVWYAVLGGTTLFFGAYYMLKMYQHVMLGETNESFCRCKF